MLKRSLNDIILKDLAKKMVMIAGPRQCGKTTFALEIAQQFDKSYQYYNWDVDSHRKQILQRQLSADRQLWIFDEIHKYRHWKNFLKGIFDEYKEKHNFLITGSAKLHAYSRGGNSLQGRYYFHRLHPFTLAELLGLKSPASIEESFQCRTKIPLKGIKIMNDLFTLGAFPEPFLSGSTREASRWRLSHGSHLIREEIRTLERILDLDKLELLLDHLPKTVGSVLSINSLREDLEVAFETIRHWLYVLENIYAVFRIPPFGALRIKAVKKEQKLYFWDFGMVESESSRFENFIASHLLRLVHFQEDVEGNPCELRYFRDIHGHEVDFIIIHKEKPLCAIKVKLTEQQLDPNLKYLLERVSIPYAFQVHLNGQKDWEPPKINGCQIRALPAVKFLGNLV